MGEPYTKTAYRYLLLIHFVFCIVLSACFVCGLHFSGSERGTNRTPYFFTSMVLTGFNLLGIFCCLYVIINTRNFHVFTKKDCQINRLLLWYNLLTNFGLMWCFVGGILSFSMGCCKGKKCYAQTNVGINIAIGAVIGVLHIICLIYFVIISGKIRGLHTLATYAAVKAKPIKRIKLESDSDSSDSDGKKKKKVGGNILKAPENKPGNTPEKVEIKAIDIPSKLPFAVLSKSIVLFMASKKKAKAVGPQEPKVETIFKQDGSRGYLVRKPNSNDDHLKREHKRPGTAPGLVPFPLQPPPAYNTVIKNDESRRNPYHLQPLPTEGDLRPHPENLYSGTFYPDTVLTVAEPPNAKPAVRSRPSVL